MMSSENKADSEKLSSSKATNPNTEPLWTVDDLAFYLKLEPSTVRSMAREGKLPAIKVGRVWRFKRSDLAKFLEQS